jgi:hypothetical protein
MRCEGEEVVLDVCRVKQPEPRSDLDGPLAQMLSYLRLDAHLQRYRFDLRSGRTSEEVLDDDNTEFPSVNLGMVGEKTRFGYTMHISPEKTLLFDGLMKYDLRAGSAETYWYGDGRWGSEGPSRRDRAARARTTDTSSRMSTTNARNAPTSRYSMRVTLPPALFARSGCRCGYRSGSTPPGCPATGFPGARPREQS